MRTENLIHPGEILREEFMVPMGISQNKLAIELRIPASRIGEIVNERRGISADTAVRYLLRDRPGVLDKSPVKL